jgi:hypothetical protein
MDASNEVDNSIYVLAIVNYIEGKRIRVCGRLAVGQLAKHLFVGSRAEIFLTS